jgi:hypothetical protein
VHHISYDRMFNELLTDLQHVCNECHLYLSAKTRVDPAVVKEHRLRMEFMREYFWDQARNELSNGSESPAWLLVAERCNILKNIQVDTPGLERAQIQAKAHIVQKKLWSLINARAQELRSEYDSLNSICPQQEKQ